MNGMCPILQPNTKLLCTDVKVKMTEIAHELNSHGGKQTTRVVMRKNKLQNDSCV